MILQSSWISTDEQMKAWEEQWASSQEIERTDLWQMQNLPIWSIIVFNWRQYWILDLTSDTHAKDMWNILLWTFHNIISVRNEFAEGVRNTKL